MERGELTQRLTLPDYPRSAVYDPIWMLDNLMGPNAVWLSEGLSAAMSFSPGARVLDLGCGKALSSIFLAREFEVEVWAADLWIAATDNWRRVRDAGLEKRVFPIHAEAHALPFADEFFDALFSVDAFNYFGTDDLYLGSYSRLVKPGGQIGIVVPGIGHEFTAGLPAHLAPFWERDFWSFHSPAWWKEHWERSGCVHVEQADLLPDGWQHWLRWLEIAGQARYPTSERQAEMLRVDAGQTLGFARVVARRV